MIVVFAGRNKDDASLTLPQQQGFSDDGVDRAQIADGRSARFRENTSTLSRRDCACIREGEVVLEIGRKINALVERADYKGESNAENRRKQGSGNDDKLGV